MCDNDKSYHSIKLFQIFVDILLMGDGYDPDRFTDRVLYGYTCSICHCVLNDPRLCKAEEHTFCSKCISQHLLNFQTCPECRQHLTLETLKYPGKYFQNVLSELKIKCDHANRGCLESVELENLLSHVNNCEYRPITCKNCRLEVNAKDEDDHKKSSCQLGGANIQDIRVMKINQKEMENEFSTNQARQRELSEKQDELEQTVNEHGERLNDVEDDLYRTEANQISQSQKLDELEETVNEHGERLSDVKGDLVRTKGNQNYHQDKFTNDFQEIRTKQVRVENNQNLQRQELNEVTNSLERNRTLTNAVQDEMRREMTGIKRGFDDLNDQVKRMKVIKK